MVFVCSFLPFSSQWSQVSPRHTLLFDIMHSMTETKKNRRRWPRYASASVRLLRIPHLHIHHTQTRRRSQSRVLTTPAAAGVFCKGRGGASSCCDCCSQSHGFDSRCRRGCICQDRGGACDFSSQWFFFAMVSVSRVESRKLRKYTWRGREGCGTKRNTKRVDGEEGALFF